MRKCLHCAHEWTPRKPSSPRCPRCGNLRIAWAEPQADANTETAAHWHDVLDKILEGDAGLRNVALATLAAAGAKRK